MINFTGGVPWSFILFPIPCGICWNLYIHHN
jgi:hypothetical protein